PWFALTRADVPWLADVAGAPAELSPEQLREAFMSFLMDFTHRANPAAIDHARFTERERAGAQVFRDRCASCHEARLIADDPRSVVPFERWESLVLSPSGPIVWSNAAYAKTGVVPYVHDRGARVPALRRLSKKWPYFTSGSARSLAEVLDRFATGGAAGPGAAYHDGAPADAARLTADERVALRAFLDLL
ncbi:MAG TPA: c-type cytochrome, partial [Kofleriaceae bacterium]